MTADAIRARLRRMTFSEAADILTLADEPELLLPPGETVALDPIDVAAARLYSESVRVRLMQTTAGRAAQAYQDAANLGAGV